MTTDREAETLARYFHEAYERLAPSFGYETRQASAVPWGNVPEPNRKLMEAVVAEVMLEPLDDLRRQLAAKDEALRGNVYLWRGALVARVDALTAELAVKDEALRALLDERLRSMPGVNPDGSVSTSSMAETIARAALASPEQEPTL
ncbi:MAG TPA: hypothetical protein VNJ54_12665 [Plantibacter sp.]|uniref:hypothetical protein n=1 Tax=Plantibacter sp. TaxID=1871045 RepID=UPI002CD51068|nr:hypothetical protein [Plantibacter sp.]